MGLRRKSINLRGLDQWKSAGGAEGHDWLWSEIDRTETNLRALVSQHALNLNAVVGKITCQRYLIDMQIFVWVDYF